MKRGKTLLRVLLVCVVLIALGLLQLYWASRSETVLRWAIEQAAQRLPGKLEVAGIRGSFMEPIAIERIRYTMAGGSVEARQASLDWSAYQLLFNKRLWIRELKARELDIVLMPAQTTAPAPVLPAHLRLPIPVRVDSLQVTRLSVQAGGTPPVVVTELGLAYEGDDAAHRLQIQRLQSPWGSLTGAAQLAADTPFATSATARLTGALAPNWPATIEVKLGGTLQAIDVTWQLTARDAHVNGTARVAPLTNSPLQKLTAQAAGLDLRTLAPAAPSTAIDLAFEGAGRGTSEIHGRLSAANRLPGTVDEQRLPLRTVSAIMSAKIDSLRLTDAMFDLGPAGRARGEVTLRADGALAQLEVTDLDLRAVHRALRRTRLAGNIDATGSASGQQYAGRLSQDRLSFAFAAKQANDLLIVESFTAQSGSAAARASGKLDLRSSPNRFSVKGALQRFDPAAFGDFPAASINSTFSAEGRLRPDWQVALAYRIASSTFRGQTLMGAGKLTVSAQHLQNADANLVVGGNRLELRGAFGKPGDALDIRLDAPALKAIGPQWSGRARGSARITGSLAAPGCDFTVTGQRLALPGGYRVDKLDAAGTVERAADPRFQLRARGQDLAAGQRRLTSLMVEASGSLASHDAKLQASGPKLDLETRVQGGWVSAQRYWSGRVLQLDNRGDYAVKLLDAMPLNVGAERLALGPARLQFFDGRIDIAHASYGRGELASSGTLTGISAAKLISLLKAAPPLETSLIVGGQWNLKAAGTANGRIVLHRESGDVTAIADDERLSLGLSELAAQLDIVQDHVTARLNAKAASVGSVSAQVETRLERRRGKWGLPGSAPLSLAAHAQVSSLKPLAALYNPNTAVDGKLTLDVRGTGTLSEPKLQGRADGEQLRIERIDAGVILREGALHATFANNRIDVSEFSIAGGAGRLTARGSATLQAERLTSRIDWTANRLAIVQRPDLFLAVTGQGKLAVDNERLAVNGELTVDRGRVELRPLTAPALSEDVVIVGSKPRSELASRLVSPAIDLSLDLGSDFIVQGRGLDARMQGRLHLQTPGNAPLVAHGEISVARGTYEAYNRKLAIETGKLYFNGPVNNPGLEIRAMRKNQQVEAGVEITGTARAPIIRLISNPEVADTDKLAWLVLGRPADSGNAADARALQSSAALLLAGAGTSPLQTRIAKTLGLDELSLSQAEGPGATGGVVTLAKRLSDRIYVIFEQSLATATNAIKVNYQLSRRLSLRTETGKIDAVDVFYSFSFD